MMATTMMTLREIEKEGEDEAAAEGDGDDDEEPAFMRSQVLRLLFGGGGRGRCDCLFVVFRMVGAKLGGVCTPLVMLIQVFGSWQ
jgi:hypothetical protein